MSGIVEKVRDAIRRSIDDPNYEFRGNDYLSDLGVDSLTFYELIMSLEEAFDIEIPDSDALKIEVVGDIVEYLKTRGFSLAAKIELSSDLAQKICSHLRIKWNVEVTSSEDRDEIIKILNDNGIK